MRQSEGTAFDAYHPLVPFACMAAPIVFCMCAFQPVYTALSLLGALVYSICLRGWCQVALTLRWQLPLVLVVAVLNPFFSAMGSTELFRIGVRAIYLESLLYGLDMGLMLVAVILWFSSASHVLPADRMMALFGRVAPTFALMMSMTNRLVPRLVARGAQIAAVQDTCMAGQAGAARDRLTARLRQVSVLMAWSMEDSLEVADAMRARGWRSSVRRTTYSRYRFHGFDTMFLAVLAVLVAVNVGFALFLCSQYSFYPTIDPLGPWWAYTPYALLVFLPSLMQFGEWLRWRR